MTCMDQLALGGSVGFLGQCEGVTRDSLHTVVISETLGNVVIDMIIPFQLTWGADLALCSGRFAILYHPQTFLFSLDFN